MVSPRTRIWFRYTCPCPRHHMTFAGPVRLHRGPPPSWPLSVEAIWPWGRRSLTCIRLRIHEGCQVGWWPSQGGDSLSPLPFSTTPPQVKYPKIRRPLSGSRLLPAKRHILRACQPRTPSETNPQPSESWWRPVSLYVWPMQDSTASDPLVSPRVPWRGFIRATS